MSSRLTHAEQPALEIGATFADYRIEKLARHQRGLGRVYVATHLESERHLEFPPWPVALKVFSPPAREEAEFRARFEQSAALQARLHHPSIVSVYEVGTQPLPFMSMTLFRGPNLADLIASGRVDEPTLVPLIESVAGALEEGIERGLVYRRLRPGGVLVAADARRAFLADFGVGRAASVSELLDGEELGTFVDYIPPEEVRGDEVTVAGNVYSLAAIVFECLTGEPPYPHQEGARSLQARLKESPRPLRAFRPDLPASLEGVLARALDAEPHERPASPGQLAAAIKRAYPKRRRRAGRLGAITAIAKTPALPTADAPAKKLPTTPPPVPAEKKPAKRGRRLVSPAVALVALLAAAAAALGALLAPDPAAEVPSTPGEELAAGTVNLRYPASWRRLDETPRIPGLELRDATTLSPGAGDSAVRPARALVAGHLPLETPHRLPAGLLRDLPRQPRSQAVDLGAVQAYRYRGLEPSGFDRVNLYVVPTTGDAVVLGCLAPAASDRFMERCERVASTLRLTEGRGLAIAPSPTYAHGLRRIVSRLDRARTSARRRLASAKTRSGQAGNARRLSNGYRVARRSASRLPAPPGARNMHRQIVASLARAERSYRAMSSAARARASGAWSRARVGAVSSEQALQRTLRDLQALGYRQQPGG